MPITKRGWIRIPVNKKKDLIVISVGKKRLGLQWQLKGVYSNANQQKGGYSNANQQKRFYWNTYQQEQGLH